MQPGDGLERDITAYRAAMAAPLSQDRSSYRTLRVWRLALDLAVSVSRASRTLPASERWALGDQLRRAAYSIPANIAEGQSRCSRADFRRYLAIANGSRAELETHLMIAGELEYLEKEQIADLLHASEDVGRMLVALRRSLQPTAR